MKVKRVFVIFRFNGKTSPEKPKRGIMIGKRKVFF